MGDFSAWEVDFMLSLRVWKRGGNAANPLPRVSGARVKKHFIGKEFQVDPAM